MKAAGAAKIRISTGGGSYEKSNRKMKGETNRFKTENGGKTLSELKNEREGQRFSTEKLLKSRYLENYQPDFAKIILSKPAYTISEAIETLEKTLKGDI